MGINWNMMEQKRWENGLQREENGGRWPGEEKVESKLY